MSESLGLSSVSACLSVAPPALHEPWLSTAWPRDASGQVVDILASPEGPRTARRHLESLKDEARQRAEEPVRVQARNVITNEFLKEATGMMRGHTIGKLRQELGWGSDDVADGEVPRPGTTCFMPGVGSVAVADLARGSRR